MSDVTNDANQGGSQNPWKWTTIGMGGLLAVMLIVTIVKASFEKSEDPQTTGAVVSEASDAIEPVTQPLSKPAASKPAAAAPAPVRVAAAPASPPAAAVPPRPTADDIAACNSYAASARTQTGDIVKNGVIGGALGAGVGAASGAIADGGKGAGKGAGIGALVGATAGTVYGLNQKSQDDARAQQAYQQCMAQRGF